MEKGKKSSAKSEESEPLETSPSLIAHPTLAELYTVFVPAAPNPASGAVYIMEKTRVHLLNISVLKTAKCVSEWGVGSEELLKAMRAPV